MASRLHSAAPGTVVIIDYLQLLDQKRENAALEEQVRQLKALAKDQRPVMVFVSQIHRRYDPTSNSIPTLHDVRLPNPLDLALFDHDIDQVLR
jgi:replicative DNA helicase